MGKDFSPYQQKIIKRYYENIDTISLQKLQELVGDIYLAEGAKATKLWAKAGEYLSKMKLPQSRIDHVIGKKDPALLASVVSELSGK